MSKDERKRDAIEMNAEPVIIRSARTRHGDKNYKCLADYLYYKAIDVGLSKQGLPREMTEERRLGKHIKHPQMLDRNYYEKGVEEELAKFIDAHCKDEPDCFIND